MKNGKRPTKSQAAAIKKAGLDPEQFLIVKNLNNEMLLVNRTTNISKWIFY